MSEDATDPPGGSHGTATDPRGLIDADQLEDGHTIRWGWSRHRQSKIHHSGEFGGGLDDDHDHDDEEIPAYIRQYLIKGEEHVIVTPFHPAMLARQTGVLAGALIVATIVNLLLYKPYGQTTAEVAVIRVAWIAFTVTALWYAAHAAAFRVARLVITPVRILKVSGIFVRHVDPLPMKRIRDMPLHRDLGGRLLGYGTLSLDSLGTDHELASIPYVPDPDRIYRAIWSILLPVNKKSPMPDEVS